MANAEKKPTATEDIRFVIGILAGGCSKRMGRTKSLLPLPGGGTLIEHVVSVAARLQPAAEEIVILGQSSPLPASLASLPILPDAMPDAGPLAGLCSLLAYAAKRWAMLLPCDMPFLDTPLLAKLLKRTDPATDAVVFLRDDPLRTYHPCCALYHPRVRPAVIEALTKGNASIQQVLVRVRTVALQPGPEDLQQLTNINTPEDYERLCGRP